MNRLFVVGDSFSAPTKMNDPYLPWYVQTADLLGMNCENYSAIGVSQDWCWGNIARHIKKMTTDDQILVVLTHPGRFWFFDDKPQMTNPNIVNLDTELSPQQLEAIKHYMMYIQRPPLDIQMLSHRLGWLESQIRVNKLKPAHVLCAFPLFIKEGFDMTEHVNWTEYENILISKGDLLSCVETPECKTGVDEFKLWQGYDCRYNHMIKSNHKILANECARAIQQGEAINITQDQDLFVKQILDYDLFDNQDFIQKELDPQCVIERTDYLENKFQTPWAESSGLFDFLKKDRKKN
jgi:hypothetical protein